MRPERPPWVEKAAVRLRELGHVISGDVFVVPRDEAHIVRRVEQAAIDLTKVDWRIHSLTIMPVSSLRDETEQRRSAAS